VEPCAPPASARTETQATDGGKIPSQKLTGPPRALGTFAFPASTAGPRVGRSLYQLDHPPHACRGWRCGGSRRRFTWSAHTGTHCLLDMDFHLPQNPIHVAAQNTALCNIPRTKVPTTTTKKGDGMSDDYSTSLMASSLGTATSVSVETKSPIRKPALMKAFSSFPSAMRTESYLPNVQ